jgi:hypothetical protein
VSENCILIPQACSVLSTIALFAEELKGQALFRNNRDIGTTWTGSLKNYPIYNQKNLKVSENK